MNHRAILSALVVVAFACSSSHATDESNGSGRRADSGGTIAASDGGSSGSGGKTDASDASCGAACKGSHASGGGGAQSTGAGEWPNAGCIAGMDQTCNAEPTMNAIAGICSMSGTCLCKEGFAIDLKTGKCGALMAKPGAPCEHGGGCNDDQVSSMRAGLCLTDGSCYCLGKATKNLQTGLCKLP